MNATTVRPARVTHPGIKASRLWREMDTLVSRQSVRFARSAGRILMEEGMLAAEVYEETGSEAAAVDTVDEREWMRYIERLWLAVAPAGAEITLEWLPKAPPEAVMSEVRNWLLLNGAMRADLISDTSSRGLANLIQLGRTQNETNAQIAERIRGYYRLQAAARANTIARTEVHASTNFGSLAAAKTQQVPMSKVWVATPDGRTRDAHRGAQGQKQALDSAFRVAGERMNFPGDGSLGAGAANTVNCRCIMAYVKPDRVPWRPFRVRRPA